MRKSLLDAIGEMAKANDVAAAADRLADLRDFGSNPGALRARLYVPRQLSARPALVVVLHGCTQTAAGYDHGSGWSRLADRHGFVLLYPEQDRTNNANLCFNWFEPGDIARGAGEALSIHQMTQAVVARHGIDRGRVYVTGLSAGGAMASVMLATYPETFAGGAIIAGLPYGCASTVQEAFGAMRARGASRPDALAALVRRASTHQGPWPTISVWHGTGDATVNPANAEEIVQQWLALHGIAESSSITNVIDGYPRRAWRDANGRVVVEAYSITGMGHGTPIDVSGTDPIGAAGPHMLDVAISSSRRIAEFWGLTGESVARSAAAERTAPKDTVLPILGTGGARRVSWPRQRPEPKLTSAIDVRRVIEDALRAGGLLK